MLGEHIYIYTYHIQYYLSSLKTNHVTSWCFARTSSLSKFPTLQAWELWTSGVVNQVPEMYWVQGGINHMIFKGFVFSDCAQNTSFGKNAFSNEIGISMYLFNFIFDRLRFFNFGAARVRKLWLSHWVVSMTVAARKTDGFHVRQPFFVHLLPVAYCQTLTWFGEDIVDSATSIGGSSLDDPNSGLCEVCV